MALPGAGFLAIWNDVADIAEADWLHWHMHEHIPERVAVPGFRAGRRYADPGLSHHRYFTLYVGDTVATFSSAPYVERLNNPTPWTIKLAPHFRNFVRGACRVVASTGQGKGGAVLTVRLGVADAGGLDPAAAQTLLARLAAMPGIVGAHIGVSDAAVTSVPTREKTLRGDKPAPIFQGVVIVEGHDRRCLEAVLATVHAEISRSGLGLTTAETGIYDLSILNKLLAELGRQPVAGS